MQLNLNKFLSSDVTLLNGVVISTPDECDALASYIEDTLIVKLGVGFKRTVFNADRYFEIDLVRDLIANVSLFGDANLIVLKFKTKPSVEQAKKLTELLSLLSSDNRMLIVCGKLDKKDLSAAWLQAIYANNGGLVTLIGDINEARTWGMHVLSMARISIENAALDALVHLNQNNYAQFQQELNKLCFLYPAGHNLTHDEVLEQLTDNAQFNVFALSNIYLQGNLSQAIKVFQNVCHETEDAILVVWSLSEDVRKLIQIKGSLRANPNFSSAIGSLRIWGDAIGAFQAANKRLSYVKLLSLLNEIAVVDTIIKGLVVGDALFKLEQIIIDFCKEG